MFDDLLDALAALDNKQHNSWDEDMPQDILDKYFDKYEEVCSGLDVDKRRWYEISTTVIKIGDRFLGVRGITNIYSESTSYSDCSVTWAYFEMAEHTEVSYHEKES